MKLTLKMCAGTVDELRTALKAFSDERFESNACGTMEGVDFDYDFVDSNDLYSDDRDKPTITPNASLEARAGKTKNEGARDEQLHERP